METAISAKKKRGPTSYSRVAVSIKEREVNTAVASIVSSNHQGIAGTAQRRYQGDLLSSIGSNNTHHRGSLIGSALFS